MTPRYEDPQGMNGWPSWPQLFAIVSSIETRLGAVQKGQDITIQHMQTGFDRVHSRIDSLHMHGQRHLDALQERVTTLEARRTEPLRASPPPGMLARLKGWAEMIAPLREVIALVAVILASLAGLMQAPAVKAVLVGIAAALGAL